MKSLAGVYQSERYRKALEMAGLALASFSTKYAIAKELKALGIRKRILEARGSFTRQELADFKELSKRYFYGTISPPPVMSNFKNFEEEGYVRAENSTILIDLTKSEEDLWQSLEKKSIRWGIKTAQKNKLVVDDNPSKQDIERFYSLYLETSKGGFIPEKEDFIKNLADTPISKLFVVKHNNLVIAGGLVLIDHEFNYSILDLTASSEEGLDLQAMPFLYWNLLIFSKRKKLKYFDLGGYDKEAKEGSKLYKINKFKERFGGQVVAQPIYCTNSKYSSLRKMLNKLRFLKGAYSKE